MADNFNLRTFLTENKLTKNAQLLKENTNKPQVSFEGWETLKQSTDPEIQKLLANYKALSAVDYEKCDNSPECRMNLHQTGFDPRSNNTIEAEQQLISLATEKGIDVLQKAKPATPGEEAKALGIWDKIKSKVGLKEDNLDEASYSDSYDTPAAKKVHGQLSKIVDIFSKSRSEEQQELDAAIDAAEQETTTQVTPTERSILSQQLNWIRTQDMEMEREGTQNKKPMMKETKLTAKERRLVEMVQDAMGYTNNDEDQEFDPGQDIEQAQHDIERQYEGSEMSDETVIPEYHNIDELMKSIDHGTNKVAEEHKIQEMKKIAEALRMKAKKMEESEHAAHISPKDLKQLATDAAKLEKAAEKLKAAFDKKFNKKEKPAAAPKAEKVEALQEGFFDLRKFLAENKLTAGSRMLNENADIQQAFSEAGLTGMVTVLFQSDSSMGEPDITAMPAERALRLVASKAANAESVIVVQANEITQGEQIGDYEEETEGLTCKLIVEILDKGVYEIWQ